MPVCDFTDGLDLDQVLLVRSVDVLSRRDDREGLKVVLGDRTGSVVALLWDSTSEARSLVVPGRPVRVTGRYEVDPGHGAQIAVRALLAPAPASFDPATLGDGPGRPVTELITALRDLVATVRDPPLQALLQRLVGEDTPGWPAFRDAPAAKHYHHAYRHGLLEHSLQVAEGVSAMSVTFPGIDRDLAVTGALVHDIGKLEAYTQDPLAIQMTDAGRLIGEIPLGYFRVRSVIESIPGFPEATAQALAHIILSHHGTLQHGSPVVPATREATLVHFLDNLGGRLGSFDRLQQALVPGSDWSSFDRATGGAAFFGPGTGGGAPDLAQAPPALAWRAA